MIIEDISFKHFNFEIKMIFYDKLCRCVSKIRGEGSRDMVIYAILKTTVAHGFKHTRNILGFRFGMCTGLNFYRAFSSNGFLFSLSHSSNLCSKSMAFNTSPYKFQRNQIIFQMYV